MFYPAMYTPQKVDEELRALSSGWWSPQAILVHTASGLVQTVYLCPPQATSKVRYENDQLLVG